MSAGERPRLVALAGALPAGEGTSQPAAEPAGPRSRRLGAALPWMLGAALLACAVGWALERRHATTLQAELGATRASLEEARVHLEARQRHLEAVRAAVDTLAVGMGDLEALVATDPEAPRPPEPAPRP
jgi:hypothetical protein